ncbi:MAG: hypothetical protein IPJ65_15665 [Archangiaceae bacterium]|nr:hypothetical protein [Archangiaceae bacterium]
MKRASLLLACVACGGSMSGSPDGSTPATGPQLLGAQPLISLRADGGVPGLDAGFDRFAVWLTGLDSHGEPAALDPQSVSLSCAPATCSIDARSATAGAPEGVLAIIVDDSGSNVVDPSVCTGCPTDPDNKRSEAVRALVTRLARNAPLWHIGLFDFGLSPSMPYFGAHHIAGYTQFTEDILKGTEKLRGAGGTVLYDSVWDVAPTVAGERLFADAGAIPGRILVVSDGEDTNSTKSLVAALAAARDAGVSVDVVGYGRSDGGVLPLLAGKAYRDLRLFASETGGFATFSESSELPVLFERIADAYSGGFIQVQAPAPSASVRGTVTVEGAALSFAVE